MATTLSYIELHVVTTESVTPHMRRVTFTGDGLDTFPSVAPDQQVKLFFSRDGAPPRLPDPPADLGAVPGWYQRYLAMPEEIRPWMRTYSIRRHRPDRGELEIDFVLHELDGRSGPASRWAAAARPGDVVGMYGPSVSHSRTPGPHDWKLFAGDETALPAIGAWLESLGPDDRAIVFAEVADGAEEQQLSSAARVEMHWVHRGPTPPGRSSVLPDAVRAADFPNDAVFAWIAGEASIVRAIRRHLVNERGLDKRQIAFTGYWRADLSHDDGPTPEDASDQAELEAEIVEDATTG